MERRDLLRTLGAAAAFSLVPREARAVWARVAATGGRPTGGLTATQRELIAAIADTILPRTDSPSATDVAVPAFVDVIVTERYADEDRAVFLAGVEAIEANVRATQGAAFAELPASVRGVAIEALERSTDRSLEPARTYWRLKGLVVHGYFTSERVQKEVLKVEVMPGRFDGAAPMPAKAARGGA